MRNASDCFSCSSARILTIFGLLAIGFLRIFVPANLAAQGLYQVQNSRIRTSTHFNQEEQNKSVPQTPASKFGGWRKSRRHGADSISAFLAIRPGNIRAPHRAPDVPLAAMNTSLPSAKSRIEDPSNSGTLPGIALRTSLPAGWLPSAVVAGDFNGDGKLDWIVAAGGDNCLFLYFGNGDGTSQLPVMLPLTGKSPVALATADLNGDGKLDLVVVEADTQTIGILFGKGDGTFGAEIELPACPLDLYPLQSQI